MRVNFSISLKITLIAILVAGIVTISVIIISIVIISSTVKAERDTDVWPPVTVAIIVIRKIGIWIIRINRC